MIDPSHEQFMKIAIDEAILGMDNGGGEVGCVIVKNNEIVAKGYNQINLDLDPTAHSEIVTIRKAAKVLESVDLSGCTLYCTLQPCGMCTMACIWAHIDTIIYGAARKDVNAMYFDEKHLNTIDFVLDSFSETITVIGGVLENECTEMYLK